MTSPVPSRVVSTMIDGPAGRLEAILRIPPRVAGAAVVAHPHPLHGGTMHTKVVHRAARLLADQLSLSTVRFNFRGVGASDGVHDEGRGEVLDLLSAIQFAREKAPEGPLVIAGFSFGSVCALEAAHVTRPDLLWMIGLPLIRWDRRGAEAGTLYPVLWTQGEQDEFGDGEMARATADRFGWPLVVVAGADHFFTGRLDPFEEASLPRLREFLAVPGHREGRTPPRPH
jgi:alpha/beta superfamily hydrolase